MFVNTLPIHSYPRGEKTFIQFLIEIKEHTLNTFENQDYQFEDLVEKVPVRRDTSRNPIFDVMFNLLNLSDYVEDIPAMNEQNSYFYKDELKNEHRQSTAKFDLNLTAVDISKGGRKAIYFNLEYCTRLFKANTIERMIGFFHKIVDAVVQHPQVKISGIDILSKEEKNRILFEFNQTAAAYPKDKTIHELFEMQVERTPDYTALVGVHHTNKKYEKKYNMSYMSYSSYLSYKKLNEKSNQLAHYLQSKAVVTGTIVGLMSKRSIEMITGILGILKAGGAYMPIDPESPEERKQYMLKDSGAKILLTSQEITGLSSHSHLHLSPLVNAPVTSLAYIIYTSGSTGRPKGVMVQHSSVVNVLSALAKMYPLPETQRWLLKTSFTFDVSVSELLGWFWGGGQLVILPKDEHKDPQKILETIEYERITHINFVPSMFGVLIDGLEQKNIVKLSSLLYIFLAGEVLPAQQVKKFRLLNTSIALENLYGPTEGTIYASGFSLSKWSGKGSVPIGKPLQNTALYIFDRNLVPVPIGVTGELCIAGHGVARGYVNNPELTAEKFCLRQPGGRFLKKLPPWTPRKNFLLFTTHSPHLPYLPYSPIYKTGDLTRWLPDGYIEFLGRIDHQIKIRGFRIELGEIENQLLNHKKIKQAAAIDKETPGGDKYICAYIVSDKKLIPAELKKFLSRTIPDYMIPSYFVPIEKIPLTPSGKIDRKVLPAPELKPRDNTIAPRNPLEEKLLEIWTDILEIKKDIISIDANFFELGGHSLKATIMISKIHKAFDVKLPLPEVFKRKSIRRLGEYINDAETSKYASIKAVEKKEYYDLSSAQKRLFFLERFEQIGTSYNMSGILTLEGELDLGAFENALKTVIQQHDTLRTSFGFINETPVQRVHDRVDFKLRVLQTGHKEIQQAINTLVQPFDLAQPPLLRAVILPISGTEHLLFLDIHHIISDGTSTGILIRDFTAIYTGENPEPLKIQYKDFALWQNNLYETGKFKKQMDYWMGLFQSDIPVLKIPTNYPRPAVISFEGGNHSFVLEEEYKEKLMALTGEMGATLYMNLLTVFNILLFKYTGQEDIIVGTGIIGRPHVDLQKIIGMFVNFLAMRNYPQGDKTYWELFREVKEHTLNAFENQDVQFEELVQRLNLKRDPSRNPLFDVTFVVQNFERPTIHVPGLTAVPYEKENKTSKFDLTLFAWEDETKSRILFILEYAAKLFNKETIEKIANHFIEIIKQVNRDKHIRLKEISISKDLLDAQVGSIENEEGDFQL
jgi:amino acid adenylation domain-containing protein